MTNSTGMVGNAEFDAAIPLYVREFFSEGEAGPGDEGKNTIPPKTLEPEK